MKKENFEINRELFSKIAKKNSKTKFKNGNNVTINDKGKIIKLINGTYNKLIIGLKRLISK